MNKAVTPELSKYFSELGKKGGRKLLEERGREYFVNIRKLHKKKPKVKGGEEIDSK